MSDGMHLSQTPEVAKPIEEDEFVGQVAGLSMKTILAACTALESLTDSIQKGMTVLKEQALVEYEELLSKVERENLDWVAFAQFIRDQQALSAQEIEKNKDENAALRAVERVFEEEELKLVARQALELEEAWEDSCAQAPPSNSYSPSSAAEALSKKRPRRTLEQTPMSLNAAPRLSVKMTPKLASCAKRFAEELSTMRRVDSRRLTHTGFVLLSADPSTHKSFHSNSFRLSSVLGATASRQEPEPLKEKLEEPRYTFGQNTVTDEEWQEAHEEMSCGSDSQDENRGETETAIEEDLGDKEMPLEEMRDDTEGSASATEDEDDDVRVSIEEAPSVEEDVRVSEQNITVPPSDGCMTDGSHLTEESGVEEGAVNEEEEDDEEEPGELSPTSSCDSEETGKGDVPDELSAKLASESRALERSPMSGFMPSAVGALLKTPLVRIQEKLGAFGRSKIPHSEEVTSTHRGGGSRDSERKLAATADVSCHPAEETAGLPRETAGGGGSVLDDQRSKDSTTGDTDTTADLGPSTETTSRIRGFHRFLKPVGPKNPANSADISGIDQGFDPRVYVEQAAWARGDAWQREVKRQAKWNPYSLFGYGVKAAQFSDVFQTPDFRRATSNIRHNIPDKTDGRISRMNRWEVDKIACAFNESEGMTQEQLAKMIEILNKTEDISDLAYEQVWVRCTPDCSHDAGKRQPWHREESVVV